MEKKIVIESLPGFQPSAKIGKVNVEVGKEVNEGDVLFSLEGKKGASEFKSKFAGILKELNIEEGEEVKKDQVIGIMKIDSQETIKATNDDSSDKKEEKESAEVVVLGGGPGGYVAAIRASQKGKSVILIEEDELGGTCLNRGCIPTKSMVQSTYIKDLFDKADIFGLENTSAKLSIEKVMDRKDQVVSTLVSGIQASMEKNKIKVLYGTGRAHSEKLIEVDCADKKVLVKFEKLILATGSKVSIPNFPGALEEDILTSDELLELREIPESLIILGGRVIAMEFAFIYSKLGTKVTVIQRSDTIFPNLDDDVIEVVRKSALDNGINLIEGATTKEIKSTVGGGKAVIIEQAGEEKIVTADKLAIATGRKPNLEGLNLNLLNVEISEKTRGIKVDDKMLTTNPDIYAIGDATNIYNLAHVASKQGLVAVDNILGLDKKMDYSAIPEAVFTDPEIGLVGMSEKDCKDEGIEYIVGKFPYMANGKALVEDETNGFVKVIANKETREVIGASLIGLGATDLLSTYTNIIANKITIDKAKDVVYAHPTVSEVLFESILDLDAEAIHK